jgi:outer membrane protein assembly factor BamB
VLALTACGGGSTPGAGTSTPTATSHSYPATGLVLLSLTDGTYRASASVGSDPVAVIVSGDGAIAYVADSSPGDVYAVRLADLSVAWKQHVGGAPFGLLLHGGRLFVSLFSGAAVVELDATTGSKAASHAVPQGPAAMTVDFQGRVAVAGTGGTIDRLDGTTSPGGNGFGIALAGSTLWTADYERAELVPAGGGRRVGLPLPVFPFWLAAGSNDTLLIAAEGPTEDSDPGGVFSYDAVSRSFTTFARPRDPDQVIHSGATVLVAAHGDRDVLAIKDGHVTAWAPGAAAVAIAADTALGLLVIVVNAHE